MSATFTTSSEALAWLVEGGHLEGARERAYRILAEHHEGMTGAELNAAAQSASMHKRLSELHRMGVVAKAGSRECRETGRRAVLWRVRLDVPSVIGYARPTVKRGSDEHLAALEREIAELRAEVARLEGERRRQREAASATKQTTIFDVIDGGAH